MTRRTPLQSAVFSLLGQTGARILSLLYFAILARAVGTDLYGDVGVGTAMGTLFAVALEPGLVPLFVRDGARDARVMPSRFAELLSFKVCALLATWPVMVGLGALLGYRGTSLAAVIFSGGSVLLVAFEDAAAAALVARERQDLEGTLRVCSKVSTNGLGLAAVLLGASFNGIIAAMCAGGVGTALVGVYLVRRSGLEVAWRPPSAEIIGRLKEAIPLALTFALWLIVMRLDQLLASLMGISRADTGDYNSVVKLVESLLVFPSAVALTFQPLLSRAWLGGGAALASELRLALEASLMVTLPLTVGGAALAAPIVVLVYGDRFSAASGLLGWQLLMLPLMSIQYCAYHALVATGALRRQAVVWASGLAVNIVANLILLRFIGILGCSLSAVLGGVATVVVAVFTLGQLGARLDLARALWRPSLAAAVMGMMVWQVRAHLPLIPVIALGGVSYAAVLALLGGGSVVTELRRTRALAAEPKPA